MSDIKLSNSDTQRTDYPTQKPLALLERIIKASSKEGDLVMDPFCGCATTLIAAESLDRQWIGIDVSESAIELVRRRLEEEALVGMGGELGFKMLTQPDTPMTDVEREWGDITKKERKKRIREFLKKGIRDPNDPDRLNCPMCEESLPDRHFHVDHIIPKVRGGHDGIDNLQLLCGPCNIEKSDKIVPLRTRASRVNKAGASA